MTLSCIVVGVDGSDQSTRAAEFAVEMLKGTPGRLVVAAAFTSRQELPSSDNKEFEMAATGHCSVVAELANVAGVANSIVVAEGDPPWVLERVARDERAALIVIGTRGRGAVARILLGSTASFLTTHGTTPVTVVH